MDLLASLMFHFKANNAFNVTSHKWQTFFIAFTAEMKKEIMIESLNGVTNEVKKLITKMDRF